MMIKFKKVLVVGNTTTITTSVTFLFVISILAVGFGSVQIPPLSVMEIVSSKLQLTSIDPSIPRSWITIVWDIRAPRVIAALIVGYSLAVSGAVYQGLFRNPLADPYLIGVASGAGLGATIVLVTDIPFVWLGVPVLPIAAFIGGTVSVLCGYLISRSDNRVSLGTLILAGVAVGSFSGAMTYFLMINADPDVKPLLAWFMGGLSGIDWVDVSMIIPYILICSAVVLCYGKTLNILQFGEQDASTLGVDVERTKIILIIAATILTSFVVSISGLIGFIGLVAPHVVRLLWGPDNRFLIPMSGIIGAFFLLIADLFARTISSPAEIPVGLVTAFCGAPFFLYILFRNRSRVF
jgi:iron complex transport system permease protein